MPSIHFYNLVNHTAAPCALLYSDGFIERASEDLHGEGWGEKAGEAGDVTLAVMRGTTKRVAIRVRESAFQPTVPTTSAQRRIPRT